MNFGNKDLENSILLNDKIFNEPEKIKIATQAQEFFFIYFGHFYGNELPVNKQITAPNLFNTANLEWKYVIDTNVPVSSDSSKISIRTRADHALLNVGFYNVAYAQFKEHLNTNNLKININERAEHIIVPESGKLLKANIHREEIVDSQKLYIKMNYQMLSDDVVEKNTESIGKKSFWVESEKEDEKNKNRFFVDEKKSK